MVSTCPPGRICKNWHGIPFGWSRAELTRREATYWLAANVTAGVLDERPGRSHVHHVPVTEAEMPAWKRETQTEQRWAVATAILLALCLQLPLPQTMTFLPFWLLPALTLTLLIALVVANPSGISKHSVVDRRIGLLVALLVSAANALNGVQLVRHILDGSIGDNATELLATGADIYVTNVIVFALWYWEFDRGGPGMRARGEREYPDFLFPQMTSPDLAPKDWEPWYLDYLYLSFTNATAFSPTDVLPMRPWAKLAMMAQSVVSLVIVVLVVARAVNVLH